MPNEPRSASNPRQAEEINTLRRICDDHERRIRQLEAQLKAMAAQIERRGP